MSDFFVTPWTVACQAPLSMRFFRQEYWNVLPFPSPGNLPDPGTEPSSAASQVDSLPLNHLGSPDAHLPLWKTQGPLRIVLNLLSLCFINGTTKPGWQHICLQHGLLNILSPLLRSTAQEKKFHLNILLSLTVHLVTQKLWRLMLCLLMK